MPHKKPSEAQQPIGDLLRHRRVDILKKGLREMARLPSIAPAHLTDLEKGRRTPSEALLVRISRAYGIGEAELRVEFLQPCARGRHSAKMFAVADSPAIAGVLVPQRVVSGQRFPAAAGLAVATGEPSFTAPSHRVRIGVPLADGRCQYDIA